MTLVRSPFVSPVIATCLPLQTTSLWYLPRLVSLCVIRSIALSRFTGQSEVK